MVNQSKYFRISVTDHCSLSCFYCHNEGNEGFCNEHLSVDDLEFVCKIAMKEGFTKFKLTGGEPTIRADIDNIVEHLTALRMNDLSMITNGSMLIDKVQVLKKSGLPRLNVTLNTLNYEKFTKITGGTNDTLDTIVAGIDLAIAVGYDDLKINFVYIDEESNDDLYDLLEFVRDRSLTLVVLPVIISENCDITLLKLYEIFKEIGIKDEKPYTDEEGINKVHIELNTGAKVILRIDELVDLKPFIFCSKCKSKNLCKEGIFPLRLSAKGVLIPCLASSENRISILEAIINRDEKFIREAIQEIKGWRLVNGNEQ